MENLRKLYGTYEVPKEIINLIELEKILREQGTTLDMIGFNPIKEDYHYFITPPDVIPFANTGGNGTHFGFLTDFGQAKTLEDAPIVCISPTNDPPIRYMARNLQEFLNLVSSVPHAEILETIWEFETNEQVEDLLKEFNTYSNETIDLERETILTNLKKTFNTVQVEVLNYLKEAKIARKQAILIPTLDGLGVLGTKENSSNLKSISIIHGENHTEEKIRQFLQTATREEKLAFIRNTFYTHILELDFDERELVIDIMKSLNLSMELRRLR